MCTVFVSQQIISLDLNGAEDGAVFRQAFVKGVSESVPIASSDATLSPPSTIQHMSIKIIGYQDGGLEQLYIENDFSHPSLSYEITATSEVDAPGVLVVQGLADSEAYLQALKSVRYSNDRDRPTVGERVVVATLYDGESTNRISESYTVISVTVENFPPRLRVSEDEESFSNRYFPGKGPVAAVSPQDAYVIDTDSAAIEGATLQLFNVQDASDEILSVTYRSPESVNLPIIAEARNVELAFGTLWRNEQVPTITSTVSVSETGYVGDVDVIIDIRHSWVGDLKIELEHNGRRELLVQSPGGQVCRRDNLFRTTFDSDSSSDVFLSKTLASPGVCQFQTQGLFTPDGDLTMFQGDIIEGEWRLIVTDLLLENDNGRLVSWGVVIQPLEEHLIVSSPPVVPPLIVAQGLSTEERHERNVESDGRITDVSVHVSLGIQFTAIQLYLPSITLVHPDGTEIRLADGNTPLCAVGNFSYLVFDDRSQGPDYSCEGLLAAQQSGSGSGESSGSVELRPFDDSTDDGIEITNSGFGISSSGSGSGGRMGMGLGDGIDYEDIIDLNITVPVKYSLADLLTPVGRLSDLRGKLAGGKWMLVVSSENQLESTLLGWSLRVAREPNIDSAYDGQTNTLTLTGADSPGSYQTVLRSIVYNNLASVPDFSVVRSITSSVFDGEFYSNSSLPSAMSFITVHHIDIDLDPFDSTLAPAPGYSVSFQEHGDPIPILDPENAILSDDAFATGEYVLTVTLNGFQNGPDEGLFINTSSAPNLQVVFSNDSESQLLTLTISSAIFGEYQPIESFEAVMRTLEYFNFAEELIGDSREIEIQAVDFQMDSSFISFIARSSISFIATNDQPVLLLNSHRFDETDQFSNILDYMEGQGPLELTNSSAVELTDNDDRYLQYVLVTIENPQDGDNELLGTVTSGTNISAQFNSSDHTLLLSGRALLRDYITVLGSVTYINNVHSPGRPGTEPRQITFVPFDGTDEGAPAVALVTFAAVNDPPMADLNRFATFVEGRGAVVIISENSTLFDVDDTNLAYIEVRISNLLDGTNEVLAVMNIIEQTDPDLKIITVTNLRPDFFYDSGTGTLRISGLDSIREYQEVLKTLTYDNLAEEPNNETRVISVVLNDSKNSSNPVFIDVEIVLVNDSPFFDDSITPFQLEIFEDIPEVTNFGISIPEISFLFSDNDVEARLGIAIVELNPGNGTAQFSLNAGLDWTPIDTAVLLSNALALESITENRIRYVPDPNFNGIIDFTIVAWDTTDNSQSGQYINATSTSNTDAFSSEALTIPVLVASVNDAPVLLNIPQELSGIDEDIFDSEGDSVSSLLTYASDVDVGIPSGEIGVAVISAEDGYGEWQFTSDGGLSWEGFGDVSVSSALLLQSQPEELNRVRFVPIPNFNGDVSFRFLAWDLTRLPEEDDDDVIGVSGSGTESENMGSGTIEIGFSDSSASGFTPLASGTPEPGTETPEPDTPPPPYPSGTRNINTTLSDPITGPFSTTSVDATITVTPINDSPVIQPGMTLQSITEDSPLSMNHGTQVAEIITSAFYSDVDANPEMGLAVIGVTDRYGRWEYTCESPTLGNWQPFIGGLYYGQVIPRLPVPEMATLLLSICWVRFVPIADFNTEFDFDGFPRSEESGGSTNPHLFAPYLLVRGWDNTGLTRGQSGKFGQDTTYAEESDTNEYSATSEIVTIEVTSENDPPVLYLSNPTTINFENTYYEDGLPVPAVGEGLSLIDRDHAFILDVIVTIYGSEFDVSPFGEEDFGSSFSGDILSLFDDSGSSSTTSGSGSGISGMGTVFSGIGIENEIPYGPGVSSAPNLPPLHRIAEYVRDNLTAPTYLQSYCAGLEERQERLLISIGSLDLDYEVLSWCPFTLRLFADPRISFVASKEQFELALRTLRYNNSIEEPQPGARTLTFLVSDNFNVSSPSNSTITVQAVNDVPVLDLNVHIPDFNNFVSYTEGQGELMLTNSSLLRLFDNDDDYLQSARIVLFEAPDLDREVLNATTDGTNIRAVYENFTLTLSGIDTVANYTAVLGSVTYNNTFANPGNPNERERQVGFYVSDFGLEESYVAIAYISFEGINNAPRLDVNGNTASVNYTVVFIEELEAVRIVDPNVILRDVDNGTLTFISAQILTVYDVGMEFLQVDSVMLTEVLDLNMNDQNKTIRITNLIPNMTYDAETGMLNITGLESVEEYRLVLETITYNNLADEPNPECRLIEFLASDGDLVSRAVYTEVCIQFDNDSPRFNTSVPDVFSPLILEDEIDEVGIAVFSFAYELIEDDDIPANMRGIAIVYVESDNGNWDYRVNGSTQWNQIRTGRNFTDAILLSAEMDAEDYIRFRPDEDFNGNASVTFVAWDGSRGMPSGGRRSAISQNSLDPFSENTRTMVLRIVPVNDAPILDVSEEPRMTRIFEDDVIEQESLGDDIYLFLQALDQDVDVMDTSTHEFGIAVVGADNSNGNWQYSIDGGVNWTNFSSPTASNAVVLGSRPEGQNRIRFAPDADFNGASTFQFKIWDRNVTFSTVGGIDTASGSTTFSVDSTTAHVTIEPVNDSPILIGSSSLTPVREDVNTGDNQGTRVSEILRNIFIDIDGIERGVAVVYVDRRHGDWQHTCDEGSSVSWRSFIGEQLLFDTVFGEISQVAPLGPNEFRATLLLGPCRIRFVPELNFNTEYNLDGSVRSLADVPFITLRGWDGTTGANREEGVDTTSVPDNHTNAFSLALVNATIDITHVNDRPILNLDGVLRDYHTRFVEPIPPERLVIPVPLSNQLTLVDPDNASLAFVNVIFNRLDGDREELIARTEGTSLTANASLIVEGGTETYLLRITPASGSNSASIEEFETVLRTIEYLNSAEEPDASQSRIIQFVASDGLGIPFPIPLTEVFIELMNDPPQLDVGNNWPDSYRFVSYSEGEGALELLGPNTTLVDFDHTVLESARVFIHSPPDMHREVLAADAEGTNITVIPFANSSEILLQGPASVEEFLTVLLTVSYENTLTDPGDPSTLPRTIQFTVSDGFNDSIPALVYLSFRAVNNPPFLDLNGFQPGVNHTVRFYEEQGPVSVVSPSATIEDIDNVTLAFIEVTITNPLDGASEILFVDDVTETSAPLDSRHVTLYNYRPQQSFDSETATLRIYGLELVYEFQEVLQTLQYDNSADEPNLETRLLHFLVSDGVLNRTGVYSLIEMVPVNDSPTFNNSALRFNPEIDEDIPTLLNPGWSVEDVIIDIILDDDSDSMQGIAIIGVESENGYWEVTWDYTTEFPFQSSGSGDFMDSASGSGSGQNGNGTERPSTTFSGLMPLASGSGDGMELIMDPDSDEMFSGMQSASSGGSDSESSGRLFESGSGAFESGTEVPIPTTPPPPKCRMTTPLNQPPIMPTFYATWYRLPNNTSITMATVLKSEGETTRIRFIPNQDFNGEVSFQFLAWDQTNGLENGARTNASFTSNTDAYSSEYTEVTVTVTPVNDAPSLANTTFNLTSILEDETNSFGDDVASLLLGVTDVDSSDAIFGIAVVLADEENGEWQFSTNEGFDWTAMSDVCPYNATVLSSDPVGANRIRFVPFQDFNGVANFSFIAWDLTSGEESGTLEVDTTIGDPTTGAFSSSFTTATVNVEPVNDSPVITQGASLIPILEDVPENENIGMLVSDIVRNVYFDVDEDSQIGIGVVEVDLRFGTWEWKCQESEPWNIFIGDIIFGIIVPANPLPERATLLNATCRIRFLPNENFNSLQDTTGSPRPLSDLPFIRYIGWDNTGTTEGRSGQYGVDTTSNEDSQTNEFSDLALKAVAGVVSVNDAPVLRITSEGSGRSFTVEYTEEERFVRIVELNSLTLTDSDHARLDSILVVVTNTENANDEIISLEIPSTVANVEYNANAGVAMVTLDDYNSTEYIQVSMNIGIGDVTSDQSSLTLSASPGRQRARIEAYKLLLSFVTYRNLNLEPNNSTRTIRFFVDDSEDINDSVYTDVEVLLLNDNSPELRNFLTSVDFVEETDTVVTIASENLTLTDADHNEYFYIANATISLYPIPISSEENVSVDLSVVPAEFNITQSYDPTSAVLTIEGSAPVSVYEAVLLTAVYENSIEEPLPGVRVVAMQVYDGENPGNYQQVQINVILVNDQPPVVTTFGVPFVFTERTTPVAISNGLTISDADSGDFPIVNITFTITNNLDGDYEILRVATFGAVSSQFSSGTLTLTGPASVADFQQTISTLTYYNTAEEPTMEVREIVVQASDGDFSSQEELIFVAIELVNDLPRVILEVRESIVNYIEGSGAVAISPNITLADNDHENLTQVTVIIINPLDMPNEILAVNFTALEDVASGIGSALRPPGDEDLTANISSSYDPDIGLLTLSGNASIEGYERLLQSLTYENIEANPGFPDTDPRMIEFLVFDGQNYSIPVLLTLTFESINDPPMVDLNGLAEGTNFSTSFTEEGGAVFVTDPDVVVFDIDNTSLAYVRIAIENLQDGDDEILSTSGNITDDLDLAFIAYENGVLLLEGLGLSEIFQEVVSAVTYQNLADEPTYETRLISFVASDGLRDSSPPSYTTVEILPVNDPPRLTISGGRGSPPPVTPPPTEAPTDNGIGSGNSGSGSFGSGGSGMRDDSGSAQAMIGSGSGSALQPEDMDPSMGMDQNDTEANATMATATPATPAPDTSDILGNVTVESDSDFTVLYAENAAPVPIAEQGGVVVEDDDNPKLLRLEVILDGVVDQGSETIFFDASVLSNLRVSQLFTAAPSMNGYLGDGRLCDTTNTMAYTRIDLTISELFTLAEWEEVIQSLRYCNSDEQPVGGERVISFRIQDPELAWSEIQNTSVFVFAVNDQPTCSLSLGPFTISEDSNITIPVLQNCMDFEDQLTGSSIVIVTQPEIGQVFVNNETGDITFVSFQDDYGTRTFEYQACDSMGLCSTPQSVSIIINAVNDPPFAADNLTLVVLEDTPVIVPLNIYFGDVEDDLIPDNPYPRVVSITQSTSGDWELIPGDINSSLEYRPFQDFTGQDQLELEVCDSAGDCVSITVTVIVQSVNDIPEIEVQYDRGFPPSLTNEDTPIRIAIRVIDVEDREVLNVSVSEVGNGQALPDYSDLMTRLEDVTDRWLQDMHILYTPNRNFFGDDFIVLTATDSEGASSEGTTINVSVSYVNDPPQFDLTRVTILEDENGVWRLPNDLFITDAEEILNAGSFSIVQPASLGDVSYTFNETFLNLTGTFPAYGVLTYTPPEHFFTAENETVTFVIRACDNDSVTVPLCSEATIHVTVVSDNDAPHLPRLELATYEDSSATLFLWNFTSDVEDGRPPIENVFLIEPFPERGEAYYNTTSGYLTYTPYLNQFGLDYVNYNACDTENHCSSLRGQVEVNILEVNDPPDAFNFFHIAREDDFDLIAFYDNVTDNETDNLRLAIVDPINNQYLEEWTTPIGGRLRVYNAHQLFTYSPPGDFVGLDRFTYSVCDTCDPRRDSELGRVDPEPGCQRQIEENSGSILATGSGTLYITCAEAEVEIIVANVNDVPRIRDISGLTDTGVTIIFTPFEDSLVLSSGGNDNTTAAPYFYRNSSALVYDADDQQTYLAQETGLNLTLYSLNQDTDIDETSLILKSPPLNGMSNVTIVDGRSRITYTPRLGFSGYDEYTYELCDKQRGQGEEARCSEAFVRVFVTRVGPQIDSVVADGAKNAENTNQDFDSKVSKGDTILVAFAEDTNMPPYGNTEQILNAFDVNSLFVFDPPFFIETIVASPYIGQWLTPTQFLLTIIDEGYPQPFRRRTIDGERRTTEVMIGEWMLSIAPNDRPCGGFDSNGQPIAEVDPYCLLSSDLTTLHSVATSPVLQGDFGLKLPEISSIVIRNVAVDDSVLINNIDNKAFFQESQIALIIREPLSYAQRLVYCEQDATEILDPAVLAESVELNIVGCANLLSDGRLASAVYEDNINLMLSAFSDGTNRRRRDAEHFEEVIRGKRQTFDTQVTTDLPVATEVILQAKNLVNPVVDPLRDPNGFVALVQESFKSLTLARVVSETLGVDFDLLVDHTEQALPIIDTPYVYVEQDEELTPQIVRVLVEDADNVDTICGTGDTITVFFDVGTDQPAVATKSDLDHIFNFSPSIGEDYSGVWLSPNVLQITILSTASEIGFAINNFNLSFTPNYFHTGAAVTSSNLIVPTETPWCIGINVCGRETTTGDPIRSVGICSVNQLSCRANQPWSDLEGSCGTGEPITQPIFPWWWILIAVVVVVLIVVVIIIIYFVYRHYKRKAQRKEALRVVRRWKKDQFAPGREAERKEEPRPWVKPPGATTMRPNPDPFGSTIRNLPEVLPRPPTAATEVENLPPIPPQQSFKPRGAPHIRPSLSSLQSAPGAPPPRRLTSVTSLPPQLVS